jgi:internalin A
MLKFEGNQALVKADVQDKKVYISVSGPVQGRRRLLAVIRSDFEQIHRDIRKLKPQEMVPLPNYPNVIVPYEKLLAMEREGISKFPELADDKVIELYVYDLLTGVDLEGTRRRKRDIDGQERAVKLFYSYSHKDESLCGELRTHLKLLQRQGLIDTWHDRKIEAGDDWKKSIDDQLAQADIILLLVSADFIASDYCYEKEMKWALERHANGEATVVPIIVRDVNWMIAPFTGLQALPKDGLAVTKWEDKDSAWCEVSKGIERIVEETKRKSGWRG